MNEYQIGNIFIGFIVLVSVVGITSIICSIIFDREPCHDYKFTPPSYQKNPITSFNIDDYDEDNVLIKDSYIGDDLDE